MIDRTGEVLELSSGTLRQRLGPLFFCEDDISMRINKDEGKISVSSFEDKIYRHTIDNCIYYTRTEELRLFIMDISYEDEIKDLLMNMDIGIDPDPNSPFENFYSNT